MATYDAKLETCCRLVFAVFDEDRKPLGTSMSPPILVLANNDAPDGPAVIDVNLSLDDEWTGWRSPRGPEAGSGPGVSSNYHLSPASDMGTSFTARLSCSTSLILLSRREGAPC